MVLASIYRRGNTIMKEFKPPINLGVRSSRHGRSTMMARCPFCEEKLEGSYAGSGKRCSCGALLGMYGCAKEVEND